MAGGSALRCGCATSAPRRSLFASRRALAWFALVPGGRELAYELAGRGRLGLDSRTFEVEVHLAELMDARISGRWEDGEVTGEARIQARDPERWSTELGFGVLLPDYETTGSLEAALTGERSAAGEIDAEGAVSVSGGLASDDGSKVLAGLSGEYRGDRHL